jgi:diguanylate cyclase (GGDEF)-like protein
MKDLLSDIIDTMTGLNMLSLERRGVIFMADDDQLRLVHAVGHPEGFAQDHRTIKLGQCLCGMAAEQGELIVSGDSRKDGRHTICHQEEILPHGHIVLPLKAREKVVGVLCLYTTTETAVNDHEKKMLLSISELIGIAMDNARLFETTKVLALHDALTGLANRRQMDVYFEHGLARAKRYGTPLTIMLLDIDHFKKYNDTFGHSAGDTLLVNMAALMMSELRVTDLIVRYGGEEFLYMLSNTDLTNAHHLAERLRLTIQDTLGVTVSIGIATYTTELTTRDDLIRRADELLYQAKNSGRNRVLSGILL